MPNVGFGEIVIILAVALIFFGPKKLPEIGKGIGKALREFNKAKSDFMDAIHSDSDTDDHYRPPAYTSDAPSETVSRGADYPGDRSIDYPQALAAESADALPYGGDYQPSEGDSQPSFRTAAAELATSGTGGDGKATT